MRLGRRLSSRLATTLSSSTASMRPSSRSLYGCTSSSYDTGVRSVLRLGRPEDLVGLCGHQRANVMAGEIGKRPKTILVGATDCQRLAEPVIGNRVCHARAPRRALLEAAESNPEVAAEQRLVDRREGDVREPRRHVQLAGDERRDVNFEADQLRRILRVGLDVRSAALRIAAPGEFAHGRRLRSARSCATSRVVRKATAAGDSRRSWNVARDQGSGARDAGGQGQGAGCRVQGAGCRDQGQGAAPQARCSRGPAALTYSLAKTR